MLVQLRWLWVMMGRGMLPHFRFPAIQGRVLRSRCPNHSFIHSFTFESVLGPSRPIRLVNGCKSRHECCASCEGSILNCGPSCLNQPLPQHCCCSGGIWAVRQVYNLGAWSRQLAIPCKGGEADSGAAAVGQACKAGITASSLPHCRFAVPPRIQIASLLGFGVWAEP